MKKHLLIYTAVIFVALCGYAQPGAVPVKIKDGKKYHIHKVSKGQTAYGIAKMYATSINDIYSNNPNVESGLNKGQELFIPVTEAPLVRAESIQGEEGGDSLKVVHIVGAGETLYSIAKKYGADFNEVLNTNKDKAGGLKVGDKVIVMLPRKLEGSEPITGDSALEDTDTVFITSIDSSDLQETYDVAIMLPFMLQKNTSFRAKCPPIGDCPYYSYTFLSLNYHHGILMAIDSIKKAGMNVRVHVYDTKNDSATIAKILQKPEMKEVDLIFGPLFPKRIKQVSQYARKNQTQEVIPVPVSNKALISNPYLSKGLVSSRTQIQYIAKYLAENYTTENVIVIKNKSSEKAYYNEFVTTYNKAIQNYPNRHQDSANVSSIGSSSSLKGVEARLQSGKINILVVPSKDLGHASNFITKLSSTSNRSAYRNHEIRVVGLEEWLKFETIDEKYKSRYHLTLPVASFVDYARKENLDFVRAYRQKFRTDPNKDAFRGFDVAFVNLKGLFLLGKGYAQNYDALDTEGYSLDSKYQSSGWGNGYENKAVQILEYNDYKVSIVGK